MEKKAKSEKKPGSKTPYVIAIAIAAVFVLALLGGVFLGIALKNDGAVPDSPFESSEFVAKIFPNGLWDFVIQLLAFVVLILFVFFVFIVEPFVETRRRAAFEFVFVMVKDPSRKVL